MSGRWVLVLEAWPYSGISEGKGAVGDQAMVGPRVRTFTFTASDFADAVTKAKLIQEGVKSHDRVWEAPIMSLMIERAVKAPSQ